VPLADASRQRPPALPASGEPPDRPPALLPPPLLIPAMQRHGPSPLFAPSSGGDGASAHPDPHLLLAQHQRKVHALLDGSTGLRFEALALFAEPLFEVYDLDAAEAFALPRDPDGADEATVTVLEAARLLWAWFALPGAERAERRPALTAFLLGPEHEADEEEDLDHVLYRMEEQWDLLTDEDRELAHAGPEPPLGFDALLAHPAFAQDAAVAPPGAYGPEGLSELEAQALFAQPLLDGTEDADQMESALERANAYWELAHIRGSERELFLRELVLQFGRELGGAEGVEQEAHRMLSRFTELFPERGA
jgi:hypothetical protein